MIDKSYEHEINNLKLKISHLEKENKLLRKGKSIITPASRTVISPPSIESFFTTAEELVGSYFKKLKIDPANASITIDDERYVLMRASSLSIDFLNKIKDLYANKGPKEAFLIGQKFLFDISHVLGIEDAKNFHDKLGLSDPISKMSAGPVHFAYSGWATVEIIYGNTTADENFFLKYIHPHSFEADSWINKGIKSEEPVCIMNAGYSSGWCEQSFNIPLTSVEISCRAKGDKSCTFIMAHPNKIQGYLDQENLKNNLDLKYDIPLFFERQKAEQEIIRSLEEKSILLKEIHHRVKNNLQIISSLLHLQTHYIGEGSIEDMFNETLNRIKAIALVHEKLFQSDDVEHVNLKEYLNSVLSLMIDSYGFGHKISLDFNNITNNKVTIENAIPYGLIINELVSNAIKYAFPDKIKNKEICEIQVKVSEHKGKHKITVSDNGVGLPDRFNFNKTKSLGFEIILSLVEQLNGTISHKSDKGTSIVIQF